MLKFKLYDKKRNKIVDYIDCSISIVDGGVQSYDKNGIMEGTLKNRHLIPLQYTGRKDGRGNEIYDKYIIKREAGTIGEEDIIGVVEYSECQWWIIDKKNERAVPLFSETAYDEILGNEFQNLELLTV